MLLSPDQRFTCAQCGRCCRRANVPVTLGEEGAGTVAAIGEGVTEVQRGDRVAWASATGSYAEQAVVPAAKLVSVPGQVDTRVAAAVTRVMQTA